MKRDNESKASKVPTISYGFNQGFVYKSKDIEYHQNSVLRKFPLFSPKIKKKVHETNAKFRRQGIKEYHCVYLKK